MARPGRLLTSVPTVLDPADGLPGLESFARVSPSTDPRGPVAAARTLLDTTLLDTLR